MTNTTTMSRVVGGREFTFSLITLGVMRKCDLLGMLQRLTSFGALPTSEQLDAMYAILHQSAAVTEPALTLEEITAVFDGLELQTGSNEVMEIFHAVMSKSGFVTKAPTGDDGDHVGEAQGSQS